MLIMRIFVSVFIAISAVIAIFQASNKSLFIAQMMGVSWGALAGAFIGPFLYGLYYKKTTRAAVVFSFLFGVGLEIVQLLVSLKVISVAGVPVLAFVFRNSLFSGVFAMLGSLLFVPLISLFTQKSKPSNVEEIFACYKDTKTVEITDSLGK